MMRAILIVSDVDSVIFDFDSIHHRTIMNLMTYMIGEAFNDLVHAAHGLKQHRPGIALVGIQEPAPHLCFQKLAHGNDIFLNTVL